MLTGQRPDFLYYFTDVNTNFFNVLISANLFGMYLCDISIKRPQELSLPKEQYHWCPSINKTLHATVYVRNAEVGRKVTSFEWKHKSRKRFFREILSSSSIFYGRGNRKLFKWLLHVILPTLSNTEHKLPWLVCTFFSFINIPSNQNISRNTCHDFSYWMIEIKYTTNK